MRKQKIRGAAQAFAELCTNCVKYNIRIFHFLSPLVRVCDAQSTVEFDRTPFRPAIGTGNKLPVCETKSTFVDWLSAPAWVVSQPAKAGFVFQTGISMPV